MAEPYEKPHYVCPECGDVRKNAGICRNNECSRQGGRLLECKCNNGSHDEVETISESESRSEYQKQE